MRLGLYLIGVHLAISVTVLAAGTDEPSYDFDLYDLRGRLFSLARVRREAGVKAVVVDFFWEGCKPCKKALPGWTRLYREHKSDGVRVVVVGVRAADDLASAREKLKSYFTANPVPFPVVFDKYNLVAKQYGVATADGNSVSLPQVFVLDSEGKLLFKTDKSADALQKVTSLLDIR